MSRSVALEKEPHRVLKLDLHDPMRGADIVALQHATLRRLEARGIHRNHATDGSLGPLTMDAMRTAAHFLGALDDSIQEHAFSVGAQRIIRYPGTRSQAQLSRAQRRMDAMLRDRREAAKAANAAPHGAATALAAFKLAFDHKAEVHYTMGTQRWEGISKGLRADRHEFPHYADCSAMFTWCWWQVLHGGADVLNGQDWRAGYTGTLLAHGERISHPEPGCAIIYGNGFPGEHVAMYDRDGLCYSHGSEAGPFHINYRYRSDVMQFRRFVP